MILIYFMLDEDKIHVNTKRKIAAFECKESCTEDRIKSKTRSNEGICVLHEITYTNPLFHQWLLVKLPNNTNQ